MNALKPYGNVHSFRVHFSLGLLNGTRVQFVRWPKFDSDKAREVTIFILEYIIPFQILF